MNMPKFLLLSVMCVTVSGLQAKELVEAKAEGSVVAKVQEPVVKEPVVSEQVAQEQDVDFAEFAKGLDMSDEERAQLIAEMSNDMDKEVAQVMDDSKKTEDKDLLVNDKPVVGSVKEQALPEAKVVSTETELPEATK